MKRSIGRLGLARRGDTARHTAIIACILFAGSLIYGTSGMANAPKSTEKIVYRFHSPGDLDKVVETANVKITDVPGEATIITYRKPRGTPGSRNYVQEDRPEDSTTIDILTVKDKLLYTEEESTGSWAVRSSATRDSYYVLHHAVAVDSAMTREADPRERRIRDDATFDDYNYPYVLVEVIGARVRLFDCLFDTTRMTGPADRKFMRRSSNGDVFVEPALELISRFLSEHGADSKRDQCTTMKRQPQTLAD
jgi:hypothetical protein